MNIKIFTRLNSFRWSSRWRNKHFNEKFEMWKL